MHVEGSCLCGALTWAADVDPDAVEICHCRDCQTLSGSAFRITVPVVSGTFAFLKGAPVLFEKVAESGHRRELAFCGTCGSSVYSKPKDPSDSYFGLRVGSLKQRDQLTPRSQCWRRSMLPWVDEISGIPKKDTE